MSLRVTCSSEGLPANEVGFELGIIEVWLDGLQTVFMDVVLIVVDEVVKETIDLV